MNIFNCDMCNAMCCYNPPQLIVVSELNKALKLGARVGILKVEDKGYMVGILQEDGKCPFLKDSKCSIYDDRFSACRELTCNFLNVKNKDDLVYFTNLRTKMKNNPTEKDMYINSDELLLKDCVEFKDLLSFAEAVGSMDMLTYVKLLKDNFNTIVEALNA